MKLSLLFASLLIVADYFINNMPYPVFDSSDSLGLYAYFRPDREWGYDGLFAVNVALEKELATVYDEYGDSAGCAAITNRAILNRFLNELSATDYRYIIMDVRFDRGLTTESDSALFANMSRMPRLVFSRHADAEQSVHELAPAHKGAYADYKHIRQAGFSRYEFIQDGRESVALRLYRELDGGDIAERTPLFFDRNHLCYNTQFVDIPRAMLDRYDSNFEIRYPYLGSQILSETSAPDLPRLVKDKIVVIGDYDNDLHSTYVGDIPGPLLSYYAYLTLHEGRHIVNVWVMLIMFVLYALISYKLLIGRQWLSFKRPILVFVASLIGWGVVLNVLKILLYITLSMSISILLPTLLFSSIPFMKKLHKSIALT